MKTLLAEGDPTQWKADILLVFGFQNEDLLKKVPEVDKCCPWLALAPALNEFKGAPEDEALFYGHPDLNISRALILGAGEREAFTPEKLRDLIATGLKKCRRLGMKSVLVPANMFDDINGGFNRALEEAVFAAHTGLYRFLEFRTKQLEENPDPEEFIVGFTDKIRKEGSEKSIRLGEGAAKAVKMARNLDNLPANVLYPETLALRAANLARDCGFSCEILSEEALENANMGCLLAVGRGSAHPPRLVILEYCPAGFEKEKPLLLVGKGLTFDSGGICLKPAANMWQMKCDMSGAGAVLAAIAQASQEKVQKRIIGILACAENMPDGNAFRPGDVLYAANGETVEIINTDAEGRLALCDALSYAQRRWDAEIIVDIATLTGACAVALGNRLAGLFANNAELAQKLFDLGKLTGENLWQLPLWEGYRESLKSQIADISHTASREGGAITAALFLQHFIDENCKWAHLDIAGVDFASKTIPLCPEGATGFGARILLELCRGGL